MGISHRAKGGVALFTVAVLGINSVNGEVLSSAFLDAKHNVHVVTKDGKDLLITRSGDNDTPLLAANGLAIAWKKQLDDNTRAEDAEGLNTVYIFSAGRLAQLRCDPVIRDFWFVDYGRMLGIDCGGLHFSGVEKLYDTDSLRLMDSMNQNIGPTEKRPDWSSLSGHYSREGVPQ